MDVKSKINLEYGELCKQLGDLQFKRFCIDAEIQTLISKIQKLNDLQPDLIRLLEPKNERQSDSASQSSRVSDNQGSGIGETYKQFGKDSL